MTLSLIDVVRDPDLCQSFVILRTTGAFAAGGWVAGAVANIPAYGVIVPAEAEALAQVPEGDRVTGSLQVICEQPIYETQEQRNGISDQISWNGVNYRVQSVWPWKDYGFYSAILVRMKGA